MWTVRAAFGGSSAPEPAEPEPAPEPGVEPEPPRPPPPRDPDPDPDPSVIRRPRIQRATACENRVEVTEWPARTDVWCWWCCHPFAGRPVALPVGWDDRTDVFRVTGCFCGWACALAYSQAAGGVDAPRRVGWLRMLRRRCTDERPVPPHGVAPPRQMLRVFGGSMTIEEFRSDAARAAAYAVLPPKTILQHDVIVASSRPARAKPRPEQLLGPVDFGAVAARNEPMRLRRPKPMHGTKNLLERTMGINVL